VPEVLSPVAGAICNLSMKCAENKTEFIRLGATDILRHLGEAPCASSSLLCVYVCVCVSIVV
jgi:hypothetical protein